MQHPGGGSVWGAVLLSVFFVVVVGGVAVLALAGRVPTRRAVFLGLVAVAVAAAVFQVGHLVEHAAQVGYWAVHPTERPWMTPWGAALAAGFGRLDVHNPALGMELLHLLGNGIFLAGVVAIVLVARRAARYSRAHRRARWCLWLQGAHVVEHIVLTSTVVLGGRAIGLSTLFGLIDVGPALWTYRIWWHYTINLLATILMGLALGGLWRARSAVPAEPAADAWASRASLDERRDARAPGCRVTPG